MGLGRSFGQVLGTPQEVDAYVIQQRLGQGQYATVYLAINSFTQERVALKRLPAQTGRKGLWTVSVHVQREITLLQNLQHESIVSLKDVIKSAGAHYGWCCLHT